MLDAGTGLRRLGAELSPDVRRVDILLTHLHMDHIQGLGFFSPLFRRDFEVHIWGPGSATADLRTRLTRYMSPPLFPVRLPELPCDLHLHDLNEGCVEVPGFTVRAALVCHPGPTVGYRLDSEHGSLAYLSDHEPMLSCSRFADSPEWCSGLDLAAGVDVLIHDAQYSDEEYEARRVGAQHVESRTRVRPPRERQAPHAVPSRPRARRRHARRILRRAFGPARALHDLARSRRRNVRRRRTRSRLRSVSMSSYPKPCVNASIGARLPEGRRTLIRRRSEPFGPLPEPLPR